MQASAQRVASMTSSMPRFGRPLEAWQLAAMCQIEEAGTSSAHMPRRFIPRLAAGFEEDAGDGLRDFDRRAFTIPEHVPAAALAIAAISSFVILTYLLMSS